MMEVRVMGHACVEIECGGTRIITDPWLEGTAFLGGWQRKYRPPEDWKERLQRADLIYVSHAHSDHLSVETLRYAGKTPIVVPDFPKRSAEREMGRRGIEATALRIREWHQVGDCRVKILGDGCPGHEDSGLVVEHGGKYLVNTVDCCMPLELPLENVEWLLAPFAGGSSPYPVCYTPFYGEEKAREIMRRNNAALLRKLGKLVEWTRPEKLLPFAGYYRETDPDIRSRNLHNRPEDVRADCEVVLPDLEETTTDEAWEGDGECGDAEEYFRGYGWQHRRLVVEGVGAWGEPGQPETRMRVRNWKAFQYAMRHRLPIDELAIGYHLELARTPDIYEADLWEYLNFR